MINGCWLEGIAYEVPACNRKIHHEGKRCKKLPCSTCPLVTQFMIWLANVTVYRVALAHSMAIINASHKAFADVSGPSRIHFVKAVLPSGHRVANRTRYEIDRTGRYSDQTGCSSRPAQNGYSDLVGSQVDNICEALVSRKVSGGESTRVYRRLPLSAAARPPASPP